MSMRVRSIPIAATGSLAFLAMSLVLATTACDQLNRPFGKPAGSSSSSSGSGSPEASADGGDGADEGGTPVPAITAQPGDIQL